MPGTRLLVALAAILCVLVPGTPAFAHDGPVLVDVVSARQELSMPPKTTLEEAHHFGMFMLKAVLDGRGAQLVDLAKTNLIR